MDCNDATAHSLIAAVYDTNVVAVVHVQPVPVGVHGSSWPRTPGSAPSCHPSTPPAGPAAKAVSEMRTRDSTSV